MASSAFAIELVDVSKQIARTHAVQELTLRVEHGTLLGFLGPNGAGKTTTIRMLTGAIKPTAGYVRIAGMNPYHDRRACRIRMGYVPDECLAYRWMRIDQIIGFCKRFYPTWHDEICEEWRTRFSLPLNRKLKSLSRGMLAKLSLLLALSYDADILVLDEPTSGLDPMVREEFLEGLLESLARKKRTVLFSSHILSDVSRLADRVAIMVGGRVLADHTLDEFVSGTKRIRTILRNGVLPKQKPRGIVFEQVDQREWTLTVSQFSPHIAQSLRSAPEVRDVDVIDLGLEDVFKDYVRGAQNQ